MQEIWGNLYGKDNTVYLLHSLSNDQKLHKLQNIGFANT